MYYKLYDNGTNKLIEKAIIPVNAKNFVVSFDHNWIAIDWPVGKVKPNTQRPEKYSYTLYVYGATYSKNGNNAINVIIPIKITTATTNFSLDSIEYAPYYTDITDSGDIYTLYGEMTNSVYINSTFGNVINVVADQSNMWVKRVH